MTNTVLKTDKITVIHQQVESFIKNKELRTYCIDCGNRMVRLKRTLYMECPYKSCENIKKFYRYDFFLGSNDYYYYMDILVICELWLCGASVDVINRYYMIDKKFIGMYVIKMCEIIENEEDVNLIRAETQEEIIEIDHSKTKMIKNFNTLFKRFVKWVFK